MQGGLKPGAANSVPIILKEMINPGSVAIVTDHYTLKYTLKHAPELLNEKELE